MSCSSCKYLNECKKSEGAVSGCSYYCSKINSYINGTNSCENYEKTYSRSNYECDKIYNDGKNYYNDTTPITFYLVLVAILLILAIIVNT